MRKKEERNQNKYNRRVVRGEHSVSWVICSICIVGPPTAFGQLRATPDNRAAYCLGRHLNPHCRESPLIADRSSSSSSIRTELQCSFVSSPWDNEVRIFHHVWRRDLMLGASKHSEGSMTTIATLWQWSLGACAQRFPSYHWRSQTLRIDSRV